MIQSVTVARRGYGSMAVSNSCGSQIINILVGLGLPWLLTNATGEPVSIKAHEELQAAATHPPHAVASALQRRGCRCAPCQVMAFVQAGNLCVNIGLILLPTAHTWRPGDHRKATLGPRKAIVLLLTYVAALVGYAVHLFSLD